MGLIQPEGKPVAGEICSIDMLIEAAMEKGGSCRLEGIPGKYFADIYTLPHSGSPLPSRLLLF